MSSSEVPVTNAAVSCQTGNASHQQRDMLRAHEIELQERWRLKRVFEVDAGDALKRSEKDKYFVSFPMAYMNGALHLGHGFTLTKAEFAAGYQRLRGKAVLFPFAYHCTGMPIQAAADRLKKEIATFGCPPNFNKEDEDTTKVAATSSMNSSSGVEEKGGVKKRGGRSKVAAKASKASYQWNILREIGIPESEIPKFVDSIHWLRHFPTLAARDLRALGFSCDYRRSFITTSCNPYFDSFVRFQMETLHERGKLSFGGRLTIFSPVENQPCADHDRAVGEGVGVLETTAVKLRLSHPYPAAIQSLLAQAENARFKDWSIFLPASTFRPETMYGQTNVFVLPEGEYGMYEMNNGQLFICSPQSALNWSYQNQTPVRGQPFCLGKVHGSHLMGFSVHAPLSVYGRVHILPLSSIDMSKGTGVVTSVPSDAPDDYAALMDLIRKPAWRAKHGITLDMVEPFKVVPVIETPGFGNQPAADLCEKLGVSGQNDSVKLAQIKEQVYREGFNNGIMLKGEYAGSRVSEAKARIRDDLIRSGDALPYAEPESLVLSRSQTTCVVALCDQWLINYGEPKWQQAVRDHVVSGGLQTFNAPSHQAFVNGIDWLREWACSRIYGLGSFLPWDPQYVIESLSDSTVYMAYYTVSHLLQGPICDAEAAPVDNTAWLGSKPGPFGIQASELNEHVWRYILMRKEYPDYPAGKTSISEAVLERLRNEFEYWYPLNLRVSGKDLVPNHLTMCLYTHAAMWPEESLTRWPRSYFVNGFTSVDSQKMSKSVGNFITMRQAVEEFGADATRFALADAGDGLEEANFERAIARGAVTKLVRELMWVRSNLNSAVNRTGAFNFHDEVFQHRIFACVAAAQQSYEDFRFRDALKAAFFDLVSARDVYKSSLREDGEELHAKLVKDFIHTLCVLLAPICPHFSQQVWDEAGFAAEEGIEFVAKAKWPDTPMPDQEVLRRATYLQSTAAAVRKAAQDLLLRAAKRHAKAGSMPIEQPSLESEPCAGKVHLHVFVAIRAPEWQVRVLQVLRELWQQHGNGLTREILQKHMRSDLGASADRTGTSDSKADRERSIKYAAELLVDLQATTSDAEAAIVLQSISPAESRLSHASSASSSPVAYCSEQQLLEVHAVRVCRGQGQLHIHAFDPSEEGMKAIISAIAPSDPVLPSILAKATPNKPSVFARMM